MNISNAPNANRLVKHVTIKFVLPASRDFFYTEVSVFPSALRMFLFKAGTSVWTAEMVAQRVITLPVLAPIANKD